MELLVVVSIIALLISILLPSLQSARESAWTVKRASNERSMAQANLMYADDADGIYVPFYFATPDWRPAWYHNKKYFSYLNVDRDVQSWKQYMPDGMYCPKLPAKYRSVTYRVYGMNGAGGAANWGEDSFVRRGGVKGPSETIQMMDSNNWMVNTWDAYAPAHWDIAGEDRTARKGVAYRHHTGGAQEGGNFQFFDGHAEYLTKQEAYPDDWPERSRLWQVYGDP